MKAWGKVGSKSLESRKTCFLGWSGKFTTIDGKNPEPVEVGSLSQYLQAFCTIPGGCLGFLPSTVVWLKIIQILHFTKLATS